MLFSGSQKLVGLVHVPAALRLAPHLDAAQDLGLQRRAKPLDLLQPSLARRVLKLGERGKPQLLVQLKDLVRAEARNGQHFKNARRDFLAHFLKRGMSAGRVELLDDVRDRVAYARYFAEATLSDDLIERKAQREEIVCRACVGFRPERIAAAERAPLPEFPEQGGNRGCIGRGHSGSMRARANRRAPLLSSVAEWACARS